MKFSLLRFVNTILLAAMTVLAVTGIAGLFWTRPAWIFDLHRVGAWVLVAALPWKVVISFRSLRRGVKLNFERGVNIVVSLLLGTATLLVIWSGFAWQWRLGPQTYLLRPIISWHWILALVLLLPFLLHSWWRWPRPKKVDFASRRAALKLLGVGAASLAGWWLAEALALRRESEESPRRFSGSRLEGLYSGNQFPITHEVAADRSQTDATVWRLELAGAIERPVKFTYEQLLSFPARRKNAILDCTLGWYSIQSWSGVSLAELLDDLGADPDAAWLTLRSVTGYEHVLPMLEARNALLATHVGGEPLSHAHGAPLRAVVPSRRGWFWVKWLDRIEVG